MTSGYTLDAELVGSHFCSTPSCRSSVMTGEYQHRLALPSLCGSDRSLSGRVCFETFPYNWRLSDVHSRSAQSGGRGLTVGRVERNFFLHIVWHLRFATGRLALEADLAALEVVLSALSDPIHHENEIDAQNVNDTTCNLFFFRFSLHCFSVLLLCLCFSFVSFCVTC